MTRKLRKLKRLIKGKIVDLYGEYHGLCELEDFTKYHHPCILVDSFNSWPALKSWQPPWIRLMEQIPPASKIRVALSYDSFSGVSQEFADMSFFEFLSLSSFEKINCYMAQCPMLSEEGLPEQLGLSRLLQDIRTIKHIPTKQLQLYLWMNIKAAVSEFHYDSYQNILCVVHGVKVVELIPPSALVRPHRLDTEGYNHAARDKAGHFVVTLTKGQALYIPEGWWHKVTSRENTVAVSMNWKGIDQQTLATGER